MANRIWRDARWQFGSAELAAAVDGLQVGAVGAPGTSAVSGEQLFIEVGGAGTTSDGSGSDAWGWGDGDERGSLGYRDHWELCNAAEDGCVAMPAISEATPVVPGVTRADPSPGK
jgi:hypothetical protein